MTCEGWRTWGRGEYMIGRKNKYTEQNRTHTGRGTSEKLVGLKQRGIITNNNQQQ